MGAELIRSCLWDKLRDAQKEEVEKLMAEAPPGRPQVRARALLLGGRGCGLGGAARVCAVGLVLAL